jgi:prepilin signal peptidase PulO-like enzyme (type II secretory pathway)
MALPLFWLSAFFLIGPSLFRKNPGFAILIFFFLFIAIVTTMTDMEWRIIPNQATYALMLTGILLSPWNPILRGSKPLEHVLHSLLGGIGGGLVLFTVSNIGRRVLSKDVMGGGDTKLLSAFGTIFGFKGVLCILFMGSLIGGIGGLLFLKLKWINRRSYIPFGPFLNISAILFLIFFIRNSTVLHLMDL